MLESSIRGRLGATILALCGVFVAASVVPLPGLTERAAVALPAGFWPWATGRAFSLGITPFFAAAFLGYLAIFVVPSLRRLGNAVIARFRRTLVIVALVWAALLAYHIVRSVHAITPLSTAAKISWLILLVGSAVYHRPHWSLRTALLLRKIDHANIYLLIAGTVTPLAVMVGDDGPWLLATMWLAALLGILKTFVWPHAPRRISATIYVVMGALPLPAVPALRHLAGGSFPLLGLGGALYLMGAVVYALRWPNPSPAVFGYHEIFHLFVFAAAGSHFLAIWNLTT